MRSRTRNITTILLKLSAIAIGAACAIGLLALASSASTAGQERKAIKLDPKIYDSYVGQYELTPAFIITVRREADRLSIQATNQPKFEIFAESETKFFLTVVDAQITFVKNDKGEVTHLILHQGGVDQRARKISATAPPANPPASSPAARAPLGLPVDMMVPLAPAPVKGDGKMHLAYELHVTNFSPTELMLARLEVLSGDGQPIAQYEGESLTSLLARPGVPPSTEKQRLGGGLRAVVFLWLTFDSPSAVPAMLRHRLVAKIGSSPDDKSGIEVKGEGAEIKVRSAQLVISPPLRGDGWLA
ncbi:MAG TPA: DUF3471 domain-containing protein, partial [Blastocatellia bacterium]